VQASKTNGRILTVTLYNPTFKFLVGQLTQITTSAEEQNPRNSSRSVELGSAPLGPYQFNLLPFESLNIDVKMNARVLPGIAYTVVLDLTGAPEQTVTVNLPLS
jgi:hypothetical protein